MIEIYDFGPLKKKNNSFVKKVSDNKQRERGRLVDYREGGERDPNFF